MKIASFESSEGATYGIVKSDRVMEPGESTRSKYSDLRSFLSAPGSAWNVDTFDGQAHALSIVKFLPVIPQPDKVLCVGVNYRPHIEEMGREVPDYPVVFVRFPASQTGHERPIIRPKASPQFDFEGELAVVIGRRARHVRREDALDYVAGYCCFMDGSVRDWQKHTMQFTAGKNFATSGSMGPWLVSSDEIPDPTTLELTTRVNNEVMQQGALSDLVFDIPTLIEYCSTFTELLPGDVIATGTPGGVGAARNPPRWLQPGDRVEVEIPGIGILANPVVDEC